MTTTRNDTIRTTLNDADPNEVADCFRKIRLGDMMTVIKAVIVGLTAASAIDLTAAATKAAATITGLTLLTGENLPPVASILSLRVTASGTAGSLGTYGLSDAGGTAIVPPGGAGAAMGIALISDDGKTLTFPNTITAFTIQYRPRAPVAIGSIDTTKFAPNT